MAAHLMMLLLQGGPGVADPGVEVEYLVVAGGGGGGQSDADESLTGGGGGAGGVLSGSTALLRGNAVTVTVGSGGLAEDPAVNGGNSVLGDLTATGGGAGGNFNANGFAGGSGGGGGQSNSGTTNGGAGTEGQGSSGGGGTTATAGDGGGDGTSSSITGEFLSYGSGGSPAEGVSEATKTANTGDGGDGGGYVESSGIVVSGAGTAAANGTYVPDGTYGSPASTKYRLSTTEYHIVVDSSTWAIVSLTGETITTVWYYLNQLTMDENGIWIPNTPPPAGPATAERGAAPAPTIAADSTTIPAENGADGVVVIAYPDDMPALTVGGGLTFDQPARAGYRVYRFTGGTGTVTLP